MKRSGKFFYFGLGIALGFWARDLWKQADGIKHQAGPLVFGWLAKGASLEDLTAELEAGGNRLSQRIMDRLPSEKNYKLLKHVIGIERWGQSRLKAILGDTLVIDEYDRYRPARGLSWNQLQDAFEETRAQTIQLAREITDRGLDETTALHNEFGELSAVHWLVYLRNHADIELWKMN